MCSRTKGSQGNKQLGNLWCRGQWQSWEIKLSAVIVLSKGGANLKTTRPLPFVGSSQSKLFRQDKLLAVVLEQSED